MLKKIGILSAICLGLWACTIVTTSEIIDEYPVSDAVFQQPTIKMPSSVIVCRDKQCTPAKLSMSKEFVYNTLLHMLDSNARKKAPICTADAVTHSCTEEYVSLPITVGITPAYMYIDDVKITDVSISKKNTSALNLVLNWGVSYNGQTPVCRPSKTLLYTKNINNIIMEDNGYTCKMTTVGTSTIRTLLAIDYIDLDYGFIGGYYSIGLSGPAFGGGTGYMIIRLPEDISLDPNDFKYIPSEVSERLAQQTTRYQASTQAAVFTNVQQIEAMAKTAKEERAKIDGPAPNVDTIISYQHQSLDYDKAKAELAQKELEKKQAEAKKKKEEAIAMEYEGVKVFPLVQNNTDKNKAPENKNSLATGYPDKK